MLEFNKSGWSNYPRPIPLGNQVWFFVVWLLTCYHVFLCCGVHFLASYFCNLTLFPSLDLSTPCLLLLLYYLRWSVAICVQWFLSLYPLYMHHLSPVREDSMRSDRFISSVCNSNAMTVDFYFILTIFLSFIMILQQATAAIGHGAWWKVCGCQSHS